MAGFVDIFKENVLRRQMVFAGRTTDYCNMRTEL